MYQLGESGREAASGEQGLIDPVDEAEGTDRLLGQATKMLRSYLKENVPPETFAGTNARWVKRHLWRTCNVIAVARWLEIIRRTVRGLIPKHSATSEMTCTPASRACGHQPLRPPGLALVSSFEVTAPYSHSCQCLHFAQSAQCRRYGSDVGRYP